MDTEANRTPEARLDAIEQRISGLTQAVAAITTVLVLRDILGREKILQALEVCETDLKRFREATHASEQIRELISEVKHRLPAPRDEWD